ncbi:MAG: hypothetical protein HUU35_04105 [Armatimonadetes bacterium]|nr:hypothetical protein [Armatimonadota bacterium]
MADLFFRTTDDLLAALRLCDDPETWRLPTIRYAFRGGQETAWLLRFEQCPAGLPAEPVSAAVSANEVVVTRPEGELRGPLESELAAPSLLQAVPLVPWSGSSPAVVFVRLATRELFREVARASLMLGNDKMRYLPLGEGRYLLRVEGLSAFLREKWRDEPGVELFWPIDPDSRALAPWGLSFPLVDKLQLLSGDDSLFWLLERDGRWRQLQGALADIYERVEVDPGRLLTSELIASDDAPTVRVELRLEPSEAREQPQLWWLGPDERPALEHLLREAGEADLNQLQVAVVVEPDDRRSFVVVERLTTPGRLAPPIQGGRVFFARLPVEHLYLPLGQRLAPLLSRRSLIDALGLGDDHLTLVTPAENSRLRVSRIPRGALRPLPDLLDYFAAESGEAVRALLDQVTVAYDLDPAVVEDGSSPAEPAAPGFWAALRRWFSG